MEELGAVRIGHGYHVVDDEGIYQMARERKIHFEVSTRHIPSNALAHSVVWRTLYIHDVLGVASVPGYFRPEILR